MFGMSPVANSQLGESWSPDQGPRNETSDFNGYLKDSELEESQGLSKFAF